MQLARHPNILAGHCSFVAREDLWVVMKFMNKGSCLNVLRAILHRGLGGGMLEHLVATIMKETLEGLRYFHSTGKIHRDIKAGNILLDDQGTVCLADFGVSGWLADGFKHRHRQTFVGTPCWMAPEVMEQQEEGYDSKADIWSLGITALELAKGRAPYSHHPPMKVLLLTLQEDPPSLESYDSPKHSSGKEFSKHFKDFVRRCLQRDPKDRRDAEKLAKHKFLSAGLGDRAAYKQALAEEPPGRLTHAALIQLYEERWRYFLRLSLLIDIISQHKAEVRLDLNASVGSEAAELREELSEELQTLQEWNAEIMGHAQVKNT